MKVERHQITIDELFEGFEDEGENGILGYDERLNIRPPYQREFCYNKEQQEAVIHSIMNGFPINVMYWVKAEDNGENDAEYELLDGQQRTISICRFVDGAYTIQIDGKPMGFYNLTKDEQQKILDYTLDIYICDGSDKERLAWFEVINTAGEKLNKQELRNATYTGKWTTAAKRLFSKSNGYGVNLGGNYIKGDAIRQEILEKVLKWAADAEGFSGDTMIEQYMAAHQHDEDANVLKQYFTDIIDWIEDLFPEYDKAMKGIDWGRLYNTYHSRSYDKEHMAREIQRLMGDPDVTKKNGVYEYLLSGGADGPNEKLLSIRTFGDIIKRTKWEEQNHKCASCDKEIPTFNKGHADHIIPWKDGGKTVTENCQVLCEKCNLGKSSKHI